MEKAVSGSPDQGSELPKLTVANARALAHQPRAIRRVILPGDSRLTAPKTRAGATRNPKSVAMSTRRPLVTLQPAGKAIESRPTVRNRADIDHAPTHQRLNSWRRNWRCNAHSRTARKTVVSICAEMSRRTNSIVPFIRAPTTCANSVVRGAYLPSARLRYKFTCRARMSKGRAARRRGR
jgi:hypothetical protein